MSQHYQFVFECVFEMRA